MTRRATLLVAALAVAALAAAALAPAAARAERRLIVVDPGHGGSDTGGSGSGLKEKAIVLDVALGFRDLLLADDADPAGGGEWRAKMTRDDDTFPSLAARASYANDQGADRFMSIHANDFSDPSANGTETFAYAEGGQSAPLRDRVQEELIAAWGLRDRGAKVGNYYVLRETAMPAILSELGFVDNAVDSVKLGSPAERKKAALAHLRGLQRHYDLAPYAPGAGPGRGAIAGTVRDELDAPLAGAAVVVAGLEAATGADGRFDLEAIPAGEHELVVRASGFATSRSTVTVVGGETAEVEVTLIAGDDGAGEDGGAFAGGTDVGCACRTGGGTGGGLAVLLGGALLLVSGRRRRR